MNTHSSLQHGADSGSIEHIRLDAALERFHPQVECEMRHVLERADGNAALHPFYGQMAYHLGWVDEQLQPARLSPGKLLRPALLLWACALASAATGADEVEREQRHQQALPVAAAVEFVHNFSLIHDDIEDRDEWRRHRRTVWAVWGEAQGINTGDAMVFLARLALWEVVRRGVTSDLAVQLARILDRTCLVLCEGQYLDLSFEASATVTPEMYLDMITRKTAALMRAATEMGARVGAPEVEETIAALAEFGEELGIAFQLRDDLLGIWARSAQVGKTAAGDLRRKKMSFPVIHALAHAAPHVRERMHTIYAQPGPATDEQILILLDMLNATASYEWCHKVLARHCAKARTALARVCAHSSSTATAEPTTALEAVLDFVAGSAYFVVPSPHGSRDEVVSL
jgi:geranylgeranyl diphosphate synthase type I